MFDNNFEELDKKYSATYEAEKRFTEPYNSTGRTVPNYVGLSFGSHLDQLEYNQYKMMRESNMEAKKKISRSLPTLWRESKRTKGEIMDVNKWKSVAVDIETYSIIRAMGENGFRRPGAMIAKLADNEVKKLAKKLGVSYEKLKSDLLVKGDKILKKTK